MRVCFLNDMIRVDLKVIIKEDNYFEMIGQIDGLGLKKQIECPNQDFEYTKPWS